MTDYPETRERLRQIIATAKVADIPTVLDLAFEAGMHLADAVAALNLRAQEKGWRKDQAVKSTMQAEGLAYTVAERTVELHPAYAAYLDELSAAQLEVHRFAAEAATLGRLVDFLVRLPEHPGYVVPPQDVSRDETFTLPSPHIHPQDRR